MAEVFRWNDWNLGHIGSHGVSSEEAEYVVENALRPFPEYVGDEKWRIWGQTFNGRYLQIIFLYDPDDSIFIIHARGLTENEKRQLRRRRK
jgi:uncharacterized DUF497 family protein